MSRRTATAAATAPTTLEDYLALPYRLEIIPGEQGGIVVGYPDLPGCFTQVQRLDDAIPMAREILEGWLEIALEDGQDIPLPAAPGHHSGRVLLRIPKSLHRRLAETAAAEGVSLNAHIATLLAARNAWLLASRRDGEAQSTSPVASDIVTIDPADRRRAARSAIANRA